MWNLVSAPGDKCDLIILDKDKCRSHDTDCRSTVKLVSPGGLGGGGESFN